MRGIARGLRGPHRDESGSIAVMGAGFLIVALLASAFAVDVGHLVLQQRELQKVADLAALDGVQALGLRRHEFAAPATAARELASASAARNGLDTTSTPWSVEVGSWDPDARTFTPDGSPDNAVRVTAGTELPFAFVPGGRDLSASAIASIDDVGGIAIGSGLASLDARVLVPVMDEMVGTTLGLDAVHYRALASADVTLAGLATGLGGDVATIHDLLDVQLTVQDVVSAMLAARQSEAAGAADIAALEQMTHRLSASSGGGSLTLADILAVAAADGRTAASAGVNVLQLFVGAAQAANGGNAVTVELDGGLLGSLTGGDIAGLTVRLTVIEPTQIAIGPARQLAGQWVTQARTAQVRAAAETRVDVDPALLGSLTATTMRVPLFAAAAEGTAALTGSVCAGDPPAARMDIASATQGARVRMAHASTTQLLSPSVHPAGPAHLLDLLLAGSTVARVDGSSNADVAPGSSALSFPGPFDWDNVQRASAYSLGTDPVRSRLLAQLSVSHELLGSSLLGSDVASATSAITPVVADAVDATYSQVLAPLFDGLGAELDVAYADVTAWHQHCDNRVLVE